MFLMHIYHITLSTPCQFQHKTKSTIITPTTSTDPHLQHHFCSLKPLSPEDALEERLLLDSIAWPETPSLPAPLSLDQTTDPAHSTFTILPEKGGRQWHVGDQLEVLIKMYDFRGLPKKSGGDVLVARLHNPTLGAGVVGRVVDHVNGSYSAVFSLLWEGNAQIEVMLKTMMLNVIVLLIVYLPIDCELSPVPICDYCYIC